MAAYSDLYQLFANSSLRNKIRVAVIVAAESIRNEDAATDNHANRLVWAAATFASPNAAADKMLMALLASNKDEETSAILGATDSVIQTLVDAAVDIFATG